MTLDNQVFSGFALIILAGAMQGSFTLPMKFTGRWQWENIWLVYATMGILILPLAIAVWTIPQLLEVYQQSSAKEIFTVMIFGFGWGCGAVLFGLGVARLGMALAFAIIVGLTAALGSLIPMAVLHPEDLSTVKGLVILSGLGVSLIGICLCARAGYLKEKAIDDKNHATNENPENNFISGLLICVGAGVLSSMLNFSLAFGAGITQTAIALGTEHESAPNAIWALAVCSGFLANAAYCSYLLFKNKSWSAFTAPGTAHYWVFGTIMGMLWMFSLSIYGKGSVAIGDLGTIVGWPILMSVTVISANIWGILTGEWQGADKKALFTVASGVAVLALATFVIGYGSTL